jgi:putative sterol carrier protein
VPRHLVPPSLFSQAWADAFRDAVNADLEYRQVGLQWQATIGFVLDDGAPVGLIGPVALELVVDRGLCHTARIISPDACTAPVIIRTGYETWREILIGALDPVTAVMRGQVRLTGNAAALMMHARALSALVRCAQSVSAEYPDQPAA